MLVALYLNRACLGEQSSLRFKYRATSGADEDSHHTAARLRSGIAVIFADHNLCNRPRIRLASASCKPTSRTERQESRSRVPNCGVSRLGGVPDGMVFGQGNWLWLTWSGLRLYPRVG